MSELITEPGTLEAAPAEPVAPADPLAAGAAAGEVAPPEAAPPVEPSAPPLDPRELQAELDYMRSTNQQLLTQFQQLQQQSAPQAGQQPGFDISQLVDEFGQLRPEVLVQLMDSRNEALLQTLDQRFQQIQQPLEQQARAATEQRYVQVVDDLMAKHVDPSWSPKASELLESRATQLLPELNQRFGTNADGSAKETVLALAIERAAAEVRELLGGTAATAQQQQAQRLAELAGAPAEPGAGAGAATTGTPQFKSPREVVEYYAQGGPGFVRNTNGQ